MASQSPQAIFSAAEAAFAEGHLDQARTGLMRVEQLGVRHVAIYHLRAIVERKLGDFAAAASYFERAVQLQPNDARLANDQGNLLCDLGRTEEALRAYDRALRLLPDYADAMLNRALLLEDLDRLPEARASYLAMARSHPNDVRAWTGLGALEKAAGDLNAAAVAYDRALALQPAQPIAAHGRARIAMERGEEDLLARYETAVRLSPEDRDLMLDVAEARRARAEPEALQRLRESVAAAPDWIAGRIGLARMRWEQGERSGFCDDIEAALRAEAAQPQLWRDYIQLLAECRLDAAAADAARRAQTVLGDDHSLMLSEAIHAGRSGQLDRAETLFASIPAALPGRAIHESVHWLRRGEFERALALAEAALLDDRWNIAFWAVVELLYRQLADPRAEWLSGQEGLVATFDLSLAPDHFAAIDALLLRLHRKSVETVGQSVREGTQTRWNLFDRLEPELATLRAALDAMISGYAAALPAADETHPLLRHRDARLAISGSWSIRLTGAGYHVSHIHPKGLVSSACYFRVPQGSAETREGWLDIGRPPDDLDMTLAPMASIAPRPGLLALFPSYLHHGTRRFSAGERMSVAFDVTTAPR